MAQTFNTNLKKSDVVESPKDIILDGVIVGMEKGLLSEFLDPSVHSKFDNLEQPTLKIHFEVKFKERLIKGNDRLPYYDEPMSNSKLGKFLTKYEELKTEKKIKVEYNDKGFGSIRLE